MTIQLAYSFHLGSDKNKKNSSRNSAKSNVSGTTSKSNNAIQNSAGLTKCDNHNYRKYDDREYNIEIIRGSSSLVDDVKKLYKDEFEEARLEYNSKQTRDDRKIDDYFKKISDNSKNDLACEIIIELSDKKYWDTKNDNFKHKMSNVYKEQVKDLELINELKEVGFTLEEIRDNWNNFSEELFLKRKEKLLEEIKFKNEAIKKTDILRSKLKDGKVTEKIIDKETIKKKSIF